MPPKSGHMRPQSPICVSACRLHVSSAFSFRCTSALLSLGSGRASGDGRRHQLAQFYDEVCRREWSLRAYRGEYPCLHHLCACGGFVAVWMKAMLILTSMSSADRRMRSFSLKQRLLMTLHIQRSMTRAPHRTLVTDLKVPTFLLLQASHRCWCFLSPGEHGNGFAHYRVQGKGAGFKRSFQTYQKGHGKSKYEKRAQHGKRQRYSNWKGNW